ncbi:MAG TPA: hypothetical protein VK421_19145 [Pyrinomonadaceae bacterium]|nr:hypothetical protein [Pyrinomonadaceae bacterium]
MKAPADDTGVIRAEVDPRITYPCYKSLDEFIDVGRLKSLDGYITERINRHIAARRDSYFLNQHRLDARTPYVPGVREIWLTRTLPGMPYDYLDLDKPELWRPTDAAEEFSELMDFLATLPFKATGRILVIYDDSGAVTPAHQDHLSTDVCHHFVWLRTNRRKPFYVLNHETGEKLYVDSYSAWFDTVNQFHGSDGGEGLTFSIRVDGTFTDDFLRHVPKPASNPASAPALWASLTRARAAIHRQS